jgi:protein-tyrosine kinase
MDRIRKALDLARQDRNRSADRDARDPPAPESKAPAPRATALRFTRTQSFLPEPDLLESNRIINNAGSGPAAAAYRMLRTQVLQRLDEHHWRSVAIFSPSSREGKTTTAVNLAANLANDQRHTVLLVDFDLKKPAMAAMLGLKPAKGADDLLRGEARIEECLFHPEGFDRLVVLPSRAPIVNSSEALAGPRARELVAELRGRYPDRILLFDLPPILGADDALAFAPLVECGLVLAAEGSTRREDLLRCMELLQKTPIVGTILNRATSTASAYG